MTDLQKWLAGFPDLLTGLLVSVLPADMRTPLSDDLLFDNVALVKVHENLGDGWQELRVGKANQSFNPSEKRLLMFLRSDELRAGSDI